VIFKYSELEKFFKFIKERYTVTNLGDWDGSNSIILRHDVDFDIKAAYDLAKLEKDNEIKSTFFLMVTSYTYNPLSVENRSMIASINEWGFEIGLHFDPSIYGHINDAQLETKLNEETKVLSSVINDKIKSISIHNPSVHGKFPFFKGYRNAYDEKIFANGRYISDSRMKFPTDIYQFVEKVKEHPIQILLHPMYYTPEGKNMPDIFYNFICKFVNQVDSNYRVNSTYRELMADDLLTHITKKTIEEKR